MKECVTRFLVRWEFVDVPVESLPDVLGMADGSNTLATTEALDEKEKIALQDDTVMALLVGKIRSQDVTDRILKEYTEKLLLIELKGKSKDEFEALSRIGLYGVCVFGFRLPFGFES